MFISLSLFHRDIQTHAYLATQPSAMVLARKPSTTKTTSVASTDVMKLMEETISASLWQLLWTGL